MRANAMYTLRTNGNWYTTNICRDHFALHLIAFYSTQDIAIIKKYVALLKAFNNKYVN